MKFGGALFWDHRSSHSESFFRQRRSVAFLGSGFPIYTSKQRTEIRDEDPEGARVSKRTVGSTVWF